MIVFLAFLFNGMTFVPIKIKEEKMLSLMTISLLSILVIKLIKILLRVLLLILSGSAMIGLTVVFFQ
jgi:hypothetical protein